MAPVQASVTGQGITYTAVALGSLGNGITVTLTAGGTAGAEVVTVDGTDISVQIESGVSTRTQVKTAIDASVAAAALVTVSVASGGTAATAAAAVTLIGGISSVSSFYMPGVSEIIRTGTGVYEITMQESFPLLVNAQLTLQAASAVDLVPQVVSQDVASTKKVVFRLNTGATPTNPAAACRVYINLEFRNSTAAY